MVGQDYDPLVPARTRKQHDEVALNHVRKKQLKTKGLEVVFDPAKHRDFITGFRKRKQQRRKDAQEQIKNQERKLKLETRAQKRAKLKEDLGLDDNWGVSSDEDQKAWNKKHKAKKQATDADADTGASSGTESSEEEQTEQPADNTDANVAVYEQQGTRTIVTTAPLSLYSESDKESDDDASPGSDEDDEGVGEQDQQYWANAKQHRPAANKQFKPKQQKASSKKGSKGVQKKGSGKKKKQSRAEGRKRGGKR